MSRDDDFDFDDESLFDEDGEDGFGFGDEDELNIDNIDDLSDFEGEVSDDFFDEEFDAAEERGGPNRTFVLLAGAMIFIFVIGLILVVFLVLSGDDDGPSDRDLTATQIVLENEGTLAAATEARIALAQTQAAEETEQMTMQAAQTLTQQAEFENQTATAEVALAMTADFEATQTALAETPEGPNALELLQTQQAQEATQTALAAVTEEPPEETQQVPQIGDVAATATAIALALGDRPTVQPTDAVGGQEGQPLPTRIPDTGLFDDISGDGGDLGLLALVAFGLVGVIFGARSLRAANNRKQ
jgi:hypothetical protein